MEPPKEWFTIYDLTRRWRWTQADVEHLLVTGKLIAAYLFTHDTKVWRLIDNGEGLHSPQGLPHVYIKGMYGLCSYERITWGRDRVGTLDGCHLWSIQDDRYYQGIGTVTIHKGQVVMMLGTVLGFEKEHGIRIVNGIKVDADPEPQAVSPAPAIEREPQPVTVQAVEKLPVWLDPDFKDRGYAPELAAALAACEFVTRSGADPTKFKAEIKDFFRGKRFSAAAVERMSKVANPYPDRGTPKRSP